ncbi:hypothetical protein DH2020_000515 [Rehmannia glutinosa]|uniref:Protein kinase domain-containing protein n=1 Tax=Rehmannia glutinosa TaxID=99300 RepID=A0ABR0XX62_REHGL
MLRDPPLHETFAKTTNGCAYACQSPTSLVKRFSLKDIKKATDGFKRVINNSSQGASYMAKFQTAVLLQFLVFENTAKGSLKEHLSDPLKTPLNWRTRLQIAIGIAAAVEYLHFFCDPPIYHVSISSSTIILDENLIPKISDISLFRAAENRVLLTNSSRCSKECTEQGCKNMIFQLGLVIIELITGQSSDKGGMDLVQWVQESNFPRSIHKMIDPDLGNNYDPRELNGLLNVARLCIKSVIVNVPTARLKTLKS